jgi:hypothetical protein
MQRAWPVLIFATLWLRLLSLQFNAFIYRPKTMPKLELCGYLTYAVRESVASFN